MLYPSYECKLWEYKYMFEKRWPVRVGSKSTGFRESPFKSDLDSLTVRGSSFNFSSGCLRGFGEGVADSSDSEQDWSSSSGNTEKDSSLSIAEVDGEDEEDGKGDGSIWGDAFLDWSPWSFRSGIFRSYISGSKSRRRFSRWRLVVANCSEYSSENRTCVYLHMQQKDS